MDFLKNPLTSIKHDYWREKITKKLPFVRENMRNDFLSLYKYVNNRPQKYYSPQTFNAAIDIFEHYKKSHPTLLAETLSKFVREISHASKILNEINNESIHGECLPTNSYDKILFVNERIAYAYLQLLESVFNNLITPFSYLNLKKRGKGTVATNRLNSNVEVLNKTKLSHLTFHFNNTVRNGIAHGDIHYKDESIIFIDNKGNRVEKKIREFIKDFDELIDHCNGLLMSYECFYLFDEEFILTNNIIRPKHILISELKANTDAHGWKIIDVVESEAIPDKTQLLIYVENRLLDFNKALFHCVRSAILTEKYASGYDRYFFHMKAKYSLLGYAAFDGDQLKKNRINKSQNIEDYIGVLEDNAFVFYPRPKLPRFILKIDTYIQSFKAVIPLEWKKFKAEVLPKRFTIRDTTVHRNGFFKIIPNPSVVIIPEKPEIIIGIIRNHYKKIFKNCIKVAKKDLSIFNFLRYLPIGYTRIAVYSKDLRVRQLRHGGLRKELVCTIEWKRLSRVQTIDIIGGIPEQRNKFRIVWNRNWEHFSTLELST